jgi:hypothetical protein
MGADSADRRRVENSTEGLASYYRICELVCYEPKTEEESKGLRAFCLRAFVLSCFRGWVYGRPRSASRPAVGRQSGSAVGNDK